VIRGRAGPPVSASKEQALSEAEVVAATPSPRTRESLTADLRALGVAPGMVVLVHSSLRSLGWVCGGPVAVVQALTDAVTEAGTIAMPTHSGDYSDPAGWENPPVPREWWPVIRDTMPAYDPRVTPTREMGAIVEAFRIWPGTRRSAHPAVSFAARGRHAAAIVGEHTLDDGLGEGSPLARLYDLGASVLLLGVGYDRNTSFHLAEYRLPLRREIHAGAAVVEAGRRVWKRYRDLDLDAAPFPAIGAAFDRTGEVRLGRVGNATARLFPLRAAVDFALAWLERAAR
jgi:aminoglycoside 3-N-acetyltransferase